MKIKEEIDLKINDHITKYNEKHENLAIIMGHVAYDRFKLDLLVEIGVIRSRWRDELKSKGVKYKDCDVIINLVYPEMIEVARKILPGEQSPGGSKGGTNATLDRMILDLISRGIVRGSKGGTNATLDRIMLDLSRRMGVMP